MEHRQRRPCHAGTLPAGTVAPGSVPAPAARHRNGEQTATAHDMHRDAPGAADRTASADRRPEQQRTPRRLPWPFSFAHLPRLAACPPCRISRPARAGCCRRCHDDHASAPQPQQIAPPATCTACQQQTSTGTSAAPMTPQPISCTACPLPAHLHRQTSQQQPAPTACTHQQQRTPQPCRLPAAADQHHPRPPNGPKPAHRGPLPEGSDSLPTRHIDYAV